GCTLAISASGCTVDVHVILPGLGTGLADDDGGTEDSTDSGWDTDGPDDGLDDGSAAFDMGDDGMAQQSCAVAQLDAPLPCVLGPTSDVIAPMFAWTWTGPNGQDSALVTPLVANLDDDNRDGNIDPCDTPEVVVITVDLPSKKSD